MFTSVYIYIYRYGYANFVCLWKSYLSDNLLSVSNNKGLFAQINSIDGFYARLFDKIYLFKTTSLPKRIVYAN